MGVNLSTIYNETIQVGYTDVLQSSRSVCLAKCAPTTRNVNVIVTGNSSIGDITITQECTAEALCTVKTELETIGAQTFESINLGNLDVEGVVGLASVLWPGYRISNNYNSSQQYLVNMQTQIINNTCAAFANPEVSNVNVFVSDNSNVGNFTIEQQATAIASCQIENTAGAYSYQEASAENTAGIRYGNSMALIVIIALVVIVTLVVIFLNLQGAKVKKEQEIEAARVAAAAKAPQIQAQADIQRAVYQTQLDIIRKQYGLAPLSAIGSTPAPVAAAAVPVTIPAAVPVAATPVVVATPAVAAPQPTGPVQIG